MVLVQRYLPTLVAAYWGYVGKLLMPLGQAGKSVSMRGIAGNSDSERQNSVIISSAINGTSNAIRDH